MMRMNAYLTNLNFSSESTQSKNRLLLHNYAVADREQKGKVASVSQPGLVFVLKLISLVFTTEVEATEGTFARRLITAKGRQGEQ